MTGEILGLAVLAAVAVTMWSRRVGGRGRWPSGRWRGDARSPATSAPAPALLLRGRRRARAMEEALGDLLELVSAPLRAGVAPARALAAAGAVQGAGPLARAVEALVAASARGDPLAPVWEEQAARTGSDAMAFVARAWALSERTGAPLADAIDTAVEVLRDRRRAEERLAAAVAGPRASMAVLCLLPLSGPVVGLACGVGPRQLYLGSPAATASALTGLALAGLAVWWSRRILARVR